MTLVKVGNASVEIPFELPARAGELSPKEVSRLTKPPRGLGTACDDTAEAIQAAGPALALPSDITPESLRTAGLQADDIDRAIQHTEALLEKLRQANLLLDHHAYEMLRKTNDAVKSQGKFNKGLLTSFGALSKFMFRKPVRAAEENVVG